MILPVRANAELIEAMHRAWLDNPDAVDPTWRAFFQGFALGSTGGSLSAETLAQDKNPPAIIDSLKQSHVHDLIGSYRAIGHLQAHIDPLSPPPPPTPKLALIQFNLSDADLDTSFDVGTYLGGGQMKLREIIAALSETYCGHVGVEYAHIQDQDCRRWLQERIESRPAAAALHRRPEAADPAPGPQGRAFREIPAHEVCRPEALFARGGRDDHRRPRRRDRPLPRRGVEEIVMGMAHRGRLNVLCSVMRKSFDQLFEQFSENYIPDSVDGDGDVKYHLGYESVLTTTSGKKVEVRLAANPSHLEIVDPVVEGKARARLRIRGDIEERRRVLPLLIHGDAALAGQGIVAETLNFSQLPGYRTGGTLHFVINNQIGFTTDPGDARSTPLLHGRRKDDRGADLPRERGRPGGGVHGRATRPGFPRAVEARRLHRHGLLPPAAGTTRPMSPRSPSPSFIARSRATPSCRQSTRTSWSPSTA